MRRLAALLLLLGGCQSFGAFSEPTTLPRGTVRVGVSGNYDAFQASDERIKAADLAAVTDVGLSDSAELDLLLSVSTAEARLKVQLAKTEHFAAAGSLGAGFFTAYTENTTQVYLPAQLVFGLRPSPDVTLFAGPSAWAAAGLSGDTRAAGFNRGGFGLLGGGVAGVALDSPSFIFCPQVTMMTPLSTGASGTVTQVSFGFATQVR